MKDGFIKVAAVTPYVHVADPEKNVKEMVERAEEMAAVGVRLLVFPELSITGYTCGDLFLTHTLLHGAKEALYEYLYRTAELDIVTVLGMPLDHSGQIYNTAVVVSGGRVLGVVPKTYLPNYKEFYEMRYFKAGEPNMGEIQLGEDKVPFGTHLVFSDTWVPEFSFAVEICEDLWAPATPSSDHARAGSLIIANLSASNETAGKADFRRNLVVGQSGRLACGYIYANAGEGESTTDLVFAGHNMVAENGRLIDETLPFSDEKALVTEIDLAHLRSVRYHLKAYPSIANPEVAGYRHIIFDIGAPRETILTRTYTKLPFVPQDDAKRAERVREITNIQVAGLTKRISAIGCKDVVVGLSGGLDSTLTLLVCAAAFDKLKLDRNGIHAITMPCFGTTDRTHDNAVTLAKEIGADFREIDIKESVRQHFRDIGHSEDVCDVTYENAQARERTQVLMDVANQVGGIVVGTGDMSELALGWATYNGDHMSMYGVNASVPKTLVRYLVDYYAEIADSEGLKSVLKDILDTPISPELLPPKDGQISQNTEDIVGPYELHDFFLYYMMRTGSTSSKIMRLALHAFEGEYDEDTIRHWLNVFLKRFFSQQYKRSCLPDGPKVGTVGLSPRGDLRMPSDASADLWI